MMKDKNIDELFRDKLKDLEKAPPAYLFDNVMAGVSGMRRKRRLLYWRITAVAAALLLAFVAGWQISEFNSMDKKQTVVVQQNTSAKTKESKRSDQKTETLSTSSAQTKVAENETLASTQKKQLPQRTIIAEDKNPVNEAALDGRESSEVIYPVKTISGQIDQKEQFANVLEKKKEVPTVEEITATSVDEQIIKQNVQNLQAQNENRKNNRWLVGAQVSPALSVNHSSHSTQYASNMLNSSSSSPVDLGGGLSVEYKPGKRWSVQSGVYYAGLAQTSGNISSSRNIYASAGNKGQDFFNAPVNIISDKMMMNSTAGVIELKNIPSGMVVGTNLEDKSLAKAVVVSDARFTQNFQYLEIPLYLRYTLVDARFDVQLMGGVSSNVLVGNNTFMDSSTGKALVGKTQDMQELSYSSTFGIGLKYGLSKRIFLNMEPRVKYYLNSLNNNSEVNYKPYTIGIFTGISYQF